jgi:hypothetical protein
VHIGGALLCRAFSKVMRASALVFVAFLCIASPAISAQSRDWVFVQSVGGLALGEPAQKRRHMYLAIRCNVSGVEATTTTPRFGSRARP